MTDETNTSAVAETDNVETTELDTEQSYDYDDPDEDQDTVEPEPEATDEGDETAEEAEVGDEDEKAEKPALITLKDGAQVTLDELQNGYLRQADYSRKTQETATERAAVAVDAKDIAGITQTFIDFLRPMLPEPPADGLLYTNPTKYFQEKGMHDQAAEKIKNLIALGRESKEITERMTESDVRRAKVEANDRIMEMFPVTRTPNGKSKFYNDAGDAASELGFSNDELGGITDPRMIALAHWAKLGMNAAKARSKAQAKVAATPPAAPRKPGQSAMGAQGNAKAFEKLNRSGSIHDAVKVDWA